MKMRVSLALASLGVAAACSSPTGPDAGAGPAIPLEAGSTLLFEDDGRLESQRATIEQKVRETLAAVRQLMPLTGVRIRVQAGGSLVIPEIGMGGRALGTTEIELAFDPASRFLEASLASELFPLLAHEMHHIMRHRAVGFSDNLFDAMVLEGLADHFAVEVAGGDPAIWARALTPAQLGSWSSRAKDEWFNSSYDHSRWFFGVGDVPRWAGYTIGFELVRAFLVKSPGRLASELHSEPSASFIP